MHMHPGSKAKRFPPSLHVARVSKPSMENGLSSELFTSSLSTVKESDRIQPTLPPILVTSEHQQNGRQQRASLIITEEDTDSFSSFTTSTEGQSSKYTEVTSTPVTTPRSKHPLPISPLHMSSSTSSVQDSESPLVKSHSNVPSSHTDVPDGDQCSGERDPVMWVITDNNTWVHACMGCMYSYSHIPKINGTIFLYNTDMSIMSSIHTHTASTSTPPLTPATSLSTVYSCTQGQSAWSEYTYACILLSSLYV